MYIVKQDIVVVINAISHKKTINNNKNKMIYSAYKDK